MRNSQRFQLFTVILCALAQYVLSHVHLLSRVRKCTPDSDDAGPAQMYVASPGEAIIEKDALDNCFYVLLSGKGLVCVGRHAEPVATIKPGEFFGEVGFILNIPRTTWVFSEGVSALLRIDQTLLDNLDASTRSKVKDQIIIKLATTVTNFNAKS